MESKIEEEIIIQEILPRLPIKSLFRFKLVSKKWLNLITHDPLFLAHHSHKGPSRTNITSPSYFSCKSELFFSTDDCYQFKWCKPNFLTGVMDDVMGSTNGLVYGVCSGYRKIFICNPITKHTVYVPNPEKQLTLSLACNPCNPSTGFTIVNPIFLREENDGTHNVDVFQFRVYSSKMGEWRESENASAFRVPRRCLKFRMCQAVYTGRKKVYWSLMRHILWFDIEEDVAGLVECPDHGNFVRPDEDGSFTEIGECDGAVSYSCMTRNGNIEIWLLIEKDNEFEWAKKHTVRLQRIIEEKWNVVSEICNGLNIKKGKNVAVALANRHHVKPLPYSGGEVLWFLIKTLNDLHKVLSFNLRTQELKLINEDGTIEPPLYPFMPTLLPCPT
ncbi:hypothetical protein Scep_020291 [Stephania cephalantha]|uniref:F-box domain-containing protein n=1 Tax=Stephania cephalantha TaxID=152367 RepID=A0AAP0ID43_9MAGN